MVLIESMNHYHLLTSWIAHRCALSKSRPVIKIYIYIYILLGSYYKYSTYKCYGPIFLDRTVHTLFNDPTRDSIANNFVISFYC